MFRFLIILLISVLPHIAVANDFPPVFVKPTKVTVQDFHEKHLASGKIQAENSRDYYVKVNGVVDTVLAKQNSIVNAGEVLISIDTEIAKTNKAKTEAAFDSAKVSYNRDLSLYKKKIISEEVLSKSKVSLETARSNLVLATDKYNQMIITAPFDGYIGVIRAKINDDVKIGDYLFSIIAENSDKIMFIELPGNFLGKIDDHSKITIKDNDDKQIIGIIESVANYISNVGTITLKAKFPANNNITHGIFIDAEIIYNQHQGLAVPEKAVLRNNKGNFVYKITTENTVKQVYINTKTRTDNMIEFTSNDLKEGDSIVIEGLTKVFDNAKVILPK
ncbi:MAG: efflux RND transporter periplasmic adaptor subunit [Rickettsiaceae bacterium]|nr:efflux RND transporter periplasmic adaptor subunit [Rickettsiaceae bacterium]